MPGYAEELDSGLAEAIVNGTVLSTDLPATLAPVAKLLDALRATPVVRRLDPPAALAAALAARTPEATPHRVRRRALPRVARAGAIAAAVVVGASTAAAATGLSGPVQSLMSRAAHELGVPIGAPGHSSGRGSSPPDGRRAPTSSSAGRPTTPRPAHAATTVPADHATPPAPHPPAAASDGVGGPGSSPTTGNLARRPQPEGTDSGSTSGSSADNGNAGGNANANVNGHGNGNGGVAKGTRR